MSRAKSISKTIFVLLTMSVVVLLSCSGQETEQPLLSVGLGERIITPEEKVQMRGFARSQVSTGVHDNLYARSLLVEGADGHTVVLMTVALCGMTEDYAGRIRDIITEKTGIPGENVVISCTHTHSGPNVGSSHDTFNKEEVDRTMASFEYRQFLVNQCAASAVDAWENREPGRIGIGSTTVFNLGMNRRRLLYGGLHPDPEVAVIKIEDARGNLRGVAFNYGCHPSGLDWQNTLLSADWPFYSIQGIKESLGEDIWVAYYQSAQGEINLGYSTELSAIGADMPIRNYAYIEKKGRLMSDAVLECLPAIETSGNPDIASARDRFDYPLRTTYPVPLEQAERDAEIAIENLRKAKENPELQGTRVLDSFRIEEFLAVQTLRSARRFYEEENRPVTRNLEQQAVRIGDAVFVTFPGELFSEVGLAIKNGSTVDKTFIIGVCCGPGGYMPSAQEFIEGDYAINGTAYSIETESFCVSSSLGLLERISD